MSDQQYSKIQTQQSYHVKSLFEEEEQIEYVLKLFVYNTQCNTKTKWAVLAGHWPHWAPLAAIRWTDWVSGQYEDFDGFQFIL